MRKQYHFRPSTNGFFAWDVDRLVELTKDLKREQVSVDLIRELDETFWFTDKNDKPTCRNLVEHMKLVAEADGSTVLGEGPRTAATE